MCVSLIRAKVYRLSELTGKSLEDIQLALDNAENSEQEKLLLVITKLSQLIGVEDMTMGARRTLGCIIHEAAFSAYCAI
jgi:hypothetical protein